MEWKWIHMLTGYIAVHSFTVFLTGVNALSCCPFRILFWTRKLLWKSKTRAVKKSCWSIRRNKILWAHNPTNHLMTVRGFVVRSVTPTHSWDGSKAGQRTVGMTRTGWRTRQASIPSQLILTHTVTAANLLVWVSEGGWKPGLRAWTDYRRGQQLTQVKNFGYFCLSLLAPQRL